MRKGTRGSKFSNLIFFFFFCIKQKKNVKEFTSWCFYCQNLKRTSLMTSSNVVTITGSLLGPGTLSFFFDNWQRYFLIMVPFFFSDWQWFFHIWRHRRSGWRKMVYVFYLLMFVDAFTIAITVVWVYARWNINFALHLRQFIPYGHFHPFSCWNFSRLMKGLNNYNNVTEWDIWFVCVAVETCEKKNFDLCLVPDIFRCVPDIFLPYFFGAWYFSTENQLMRLFFFLTLYLWKSVIATF